MCGIAGIYLRDKNKNVDKLDDLADCLLLGIEDRGRDATGYAAMTFDGRIAMQKASCYAAEFVRDRRLLPTDSQIILLHTRFATQGSPAWIENNHPINYDGIYCIHNGSIYNDNLVFKELNLLREAMVDSEAIPAATSVNDWTPEGVSSAVELLEGSYAVAMFKHGVPGQAVMLRGNSYPLVVLVTDKLIVWASTKNCIVDAWKRVYGTPPAHSRFTYAKEGDLFWVNDGEMSSHKFSPKSYPKYTSSNGWNDFELGNGYYSTPKSNSAMATKSNTATPKQITAAKKADSNPLTVKLAAQLSLSTDEAKWMKTLSVLMGLERSGHAEEGCVAAYVDAVNTNNNIIDCPECQEPTLVKLFRIVVTDGAKMCNECWQDHIKMGIIDEAGNILHEGLVLNDEEIQMTQEEIEERESILNLCREMGLDPDDLSDEELEDILKMQEEERHKFFYGPVA